MRFFTKELWSKINAPDENIRRQAEMEWAANDTVYQRRFMNIKKSLPSVFVKEYLDRKGFHGYTIQDIAISQTDSEYSCKLELCNGAETVLLMMNGLKSVQIGVKSFHYGIRKKLIWGYSEFELTPEHNFQLSILCDIKNEIQFEFKTISFVSGPEDK